ncbi:ABC transporter permease [Acidaminobacter sp. JC074]|uniref:ABC transporter permease n=1 Tax=Acidaminobacter sp. JC074 TaxID=2530199 RepID=UPI001F100893
MREWLKKEKTLERIAPFAAILFGLIVGVLLILFTKNSPAEGFKYLFQGATGIKNWEITNWKKIGNLLLVATPLMLAGLAVAFSFRTGIFNIGVSGQMLVGGLAATVVGTQFESIPRLIHVPMVIVVAAIAGALWAFVPAILKAKYKVNEVVTTIMMNYIALETVSYVVRNFIQSDHFDTESMKVLPTATLRMDWLTALFDRSNVNMGLFIALIVAVIYAFILNRTTFGYELKAVGYNKDASEYAGIKVNTRILHALMISGGIAGLAGVTFYLGNTDHIAIGKLPTYGFDGIVVALLGLNSAIGIVLSSLLLAFFKVGAGSVKANLVNNVPNQLVPMIISVIIYFSATSEMFKKMIKKLVSSKKKGGAK